MRKWRVDVVIGIIGLLVSVLFGLASLIEPEIRQEIGIEASPLCVRKSCREEYLKLVGRAKEKMSGMRSPVKFPLGVNHPVKMENAAANSAQTWEAIGFVTRQGEAKQIFPTDLREMFDRHLNVIDGSNRPVQSSGFPVIDIIARNTQTGEVYVLPNVAYLSVLKDALNAALNQELSLNNTDMRRLRL